MNRSFTVGELSITNQWPLMNGNAWSMVVKKSSMMFSLGWMMGATLIQACFSMSVSGANPAYSRVG
jgi:hypothetical protein